MSKKTSIYLFAAVLLLGCSAERADAQFIGYSSPQTVNQQIFSAVNTTQASPLSNANPALCQTIPISTPACAIPNVGQSIHYITIRSSAGRNIRVTLQGSNDGVNWFDMGESSSDPGLNSSGVGFSGFAASGSFSAYRINFIAGNGSGSSSVWYSGTSVSNGSIGGALNLSAQYRRILALAPNSSLTLTATQVPVFPPAGNSVGTLYFEFETNNCAGGSLVVQSGPDSNHQSNLITITPANLGGLTLQAFPIPASNAGAMTFSYTACGTETYDTYMEFSQPGSYNGFLGTDITTATATAVKATAGVVHTLTVNTGAAGTIILFDLAAASCTGTPATNQKATITATTTTVQTLTYDMNFLNGICAKSSVAMDYTISFQ
jgi:hypothetical protein